MFTIPTIGQSDISLQLPTATNTTIANHGRHQQKWPPSTPHEALRFAPMHQMNGCWESRMATIAIKNIDNRLF